MAQTANTLNPEVPETREPLTAAEAPVLPQRRAKGLRSALVSAVALVAIGAGIYGYVRYERAHRPPDVTYKTSHAEMHRIVGRVTASGTLQATVTVQVGTQVSGRVQKLYVDYNSTVKKGQIIAKIDPLLFQAALAQSRANFAQMTAAVAQARATLLNAQRVYDRTKSLNAQSLAAQADVDTADSNLQFAKAGVDVAKANLDQARAQLNQAEVNLSYTDIFSPIDGVVISRSVDVGQTVAASLQAPIIFTIAEDLRKMQVNTNVAEGDVGRLKEGSSAYFSVDAFPGQVFRGKIAQIRNSATSVQNVVTYDAVIDVVNDDLKLRPGMTANTTVIYDQREHALAIPNAALRYHPRDASPSASASHTGHRYGGGGGGDPAGANSFGGGAHDGSGHGNHEGPRDHSNDPKTIYVLRDGKPVAVSVHVGLTDGTSTEVVDGDIKEGDEVITEAIFANQPAPTSTGQRQGGGMGGPGGGMRPPF